MLKRNMKIMIIFIVFSWFLFYSVQKNNRILYNNENLNHNYRNTYDVVYDFSWGIATIKDRWENLFINEKWEKLFLPKNYTITTNIHWEKIIWNNNIIPIMHNIDNPHIPWQKYWWFVNLKWEITSKYYYDEVYLSKYWYSVIGRNSKRWLVNQKWEEVIPPSYINLSTTDGKIFVAQKSFIDKQWNSYEKWGYLNSKWEVIIPFIYNFANDFNDNIAKVEKDGNVFFINTKWEKITDMFWEKYRIVEYNDWLFLAENIDWKYGFLDEKLNIKINFDYDEATIFSWYEKNWISLVKKWNTRYYINKNWEIIIKVKDNFFPYTFKEWLARQEHILSWTWNKWEVINTKWEVVIWSWQLSDKKWWFYKLYSWFYEWYAIITDWNKYWYISQNWKVLFSPVFDRFTYFNNWIAEVEKNGTRYYLYKNWFMKINNFSDWIKTIY